jgi:hypothetical protein
MRRAKLVLAAAALMVATMVALAAPAIADDHHHHGIHFFHHDDFTFGDFEQDADSGDIDQTFDVSQTGDNSNQCVGITGNANTGNAQNQIGVTQFGDFGFFDGGFDDFEFDDSGATLDVSGSSDVSCTQEVNQAAAAG